MRRSAEKTSQQLRDPIERLRAAIPGAFFRPRQVEAAGLSLGNLRTLVRQGRIEKVARGLYRFAAAEPTEKYSLAMVCARVPQSVICLVSALSVHEIGTQIPHGVWLAIPHKAEPPRISGIRIELVRFSGAAWTCGVQETRFEGVPARITSPARTVVDCFRYQRLLGPEAPMEALQDALKRRKVTVAQLAQVLEHLPSRRLSAALDVRSI